MNEQEAIVRRLDRLLFKAQFILDEMSAVGRKDAASDKKIKKLLADTHKAAAAIWRRSKSKRNKQYDASNLPPKLRWIAQELMDQLDTLTEQLHNSEITNSEWQDEFQILMAQYAQAGYMAGADSDIVSASEITMMTDFLDGQFSFLSDFSAEIQSESEWIAGWTTRAESYALSIKIPYWNGEVDMLPLPAMPAQGTQCQNNCGCAWRVDKLDEEAGDYDAYWERSKDDSCQTCIEREAQWSPVQIRGGVLQS